MIWWGSAGVVRVGYGGHLPEAEEAKRGAQPGGGGRQVSQVRVLAEVQPANAPAAAAAARTATLPFHWRMRGASIHGFSLNSGVFTTAAILHCTSLHGGCQRGASSGYWGISSM